MGELQALDAVGQRPGAEHVEQGVGDAHGHGAEQDLLPVRQQVTQRVLGGALLLGGLLEHRGLGHAGTHVQADGHQHGGAQEGDAPAEGEHLLLAQVGLKHQVQTIGAEEADRGAQVREGAIQGTLVGRGVLGGDQGRAGPFTGEPHALAGAADAQDHDGPCADLLIAGQASDQEGGDAHGHQGDDQRLLAAELVAEVAEQHGTERAGEERYGEGHESHQRGQGLVGLGDVREENRAEIAGGCDGIAVVVVEFDGGAHHRGGDDLGNGILLHRFGHSRGCACRHCPSSFSSCG